MELPHIHTPQDWKHCSLCRSGREARRTLERTRSRKVDWTATQAQEDPLQDDVTPVTLEEAVANIAKLMAASSQYCERYHRGISVGSVPCSPVSATDTSHCLRYHTPQVPAHPTPPHREVCLSLPGGSYCVEGTAGQNGTGNNHLIHLTPSQTVRVYFNH